MKKFICVIFLIAAVTAALAMAAACEDRDPSDTEYWFSNHSYEFVPYNGEDNLDNAGSYWRFTSARTVDVTMSVRLNVDNYSSAAYLYVNGEQVKSEADTGIYTYVYNLSLGSGDVLELHAFWTNSLMTDSEGFEITLLTMTSGGNTYLLEEFDQSYAVAGIAA